MYDYLKTTILIDVQCQQCGCSKELGEMFADTHRNVLMCANCLINERVSRETMRGRLSYLPDFFGELLAVFETTTAGIPTKVKELCDQLKESCLTLMKSTMEQLEMFAQEVDEVCLAASSRAKRYADQQLLNQHIVEKLNDRTLSAKDIKMHMEKGQRLNHKSYVEHMACSCDEMADLLRRITTFELKLPTVEQVTPTTYHPVCDSPLLSVVALNGFIATASAKGMISTLAGSKIVVNRGHDGQTRSLAWYENYLVSGGDDFKIKVWEVEDTGNLKLLKSFGDSFQKKSHYRNMLALERYGLIVTCTGANNNHRLRGWNFETQALEFELEGHQDYIRTLTEVPNSPYIISSSSDRTIRVWDVLERRMKQLIHNHQKILSCGYINRLGLIVVLEEGNHIVVYPLAMWRPTIRLNQWKVSKSVTSMCIVEEQNIAVAGPGFVELWTSTGQRKHSFPVDDKRKITSMLYHNKTLYGCEGTGRLIELSLKNSKNLEQHPTPVLQKSSSV